MSVSVALQDLILSLLKADNAVAAIVADRVIDGPTSKTSFPYISLGASDIELIDAECMRGRDETVQIDCWTRDDGKLWRCKRLVDAVQGALHEKEGPLSSGALISLNVVLMRSFIDRDNITAHGVVQVTAELEE
ncbi:DUF3168 domain-containing protein [Neorhizobium alkalisoli]|uniref:Uncharacterized protein DUF3168 n=1 Tax=Neorhizobium alkalisoli TaxID=528178 RepID=A0A561QS96_9HYPH|nr:DUF3168 domain-containing protein [Neorhizobium alkalisoli]TWF53261.1 uncharacterized protein DUF3168 [Neorhizobium alkalisoli]